MENRLRAPIQVMLTDKMRNEFRETAKEKGDIPSDLLRGFIESYIDENKEELK